MNPTPKSLIGQLNKALVALVSACWLAGTLGVAWYVDREISETLDSSLVQSANRLLELAAHELEEVKSHPESKLGTAAAKAAATSTVIAAPADEKANEVVGGEFLMYQVVNGQGKLEMRSQDAPAEPLPVALANGFAQTPLWRIYTLRHPVQDLFIHVGDPLAHRAEARNESLLFLLTPLLGVVPLLVMGIRRVVKAQMQPVDRVAEQVGLRGGTNLSAVDTTDLPDELRGLVTNVNRLLERLNDALQTERTLSASAAHELRTPLTVAQLRLSSALAQALPDAARAEVVSASNALAQLKRRTEKLLQLSRAESGATLNRESVSLNQVVAALFQEYEGDAVVLERLQVNMEDGQQVMGDFDAIAIALRNLVENSLRYGGDSAVEIRATEPGVLVVRDGGPGVTPAQLHELAQRHVRYAHQKAGFGLGLSIVKTIMERQNGQLEIVSPPPGMAHGFEARMVFS